ncbi:FtsX-like permease family protein [Buchnera aphidicola (Hyperomyzus lactucae)]|uniref:FtsX-like permease family protein n=1 Tax=Buchnera aphidicola (Hyperomyzus lactucae) TaxID=1241860 RepID=A0A4D6Y4T1_9GAMM|nr:FtsX-like permease family protein [Buchnera aphidicola]QCI21020.1 FtsX-like permease family protein [Buchnera aphidicola (Hyperomyzus lactucae)]
MNFLPFLIAERLYLKKNKNYTLFLISILSKIGISVSVFVLIISFSAFNGFQILLNQKILSGLPHGVIQLTDQSLLKWQDIIKKLKFFPEITYAEPYILTNGLLLINNKTKLIEIKSFSNIKNFKKKFSLQYKKNDFFNKNNTHEIILSSYLAKYLSIKKGSSINLIILNKNEKHFAFHLRYFPLKVTDVFESHGMLDSNIGYVPFNFFKKHLAINNAVNSIELNTSNPLNANQIIINVAKKIKTPLLIYTWINSYKNIYEDVKKIKAIIYIALLLLVIISSFSIASISLMTISKKTQEIAILRSIGANNFLVQVIFLYYGLRSIIIGSLIGLCIGIITILNFKSILYFLEKCFKQNILLDNIYYNNFLLLKLNTLDVIIIFTSTIIVGIITNWYPAYYASQINPSVILKEY